MNIAKYIFSISEFWPVRRAILIDPTCRRFFLRMHLTTRDRKFSTSFQGSARLDLMKLKRRLTIPIASQPASQLADFAPKWCCIAFIDRAHVTVSSNYWNLTLFKSIFWEKTGTGHLVMDSEDKKYALISGTYQWVLTRESPPPPPSPTQGLVASLNLFQSCDSTMMLR